MPCVCGECSGCTRYDGKPQVMPSGFVDQIVVCCNPDCGWCGVESEYKPDAEKEPEQLEMFSTFGGYQSPST